MSYTNTILQKKLKVINQLNNQIKNLSSEINGLKEQLNYTAPIRLFFCYGKSWSSAPQLATFSPLDGTQLMCSDLTSSTESHRAIAFRLNVNELYIYYGTTAPEIRAPNGIGGLWVQSGNLVDNEGAISIKGMVVDLTNYKPAMVFPRDELVNKYLWKGNKDSELGLVYTVFCGTIPFQDFIAVAIVNLFGYSFIRLRKMIYTRLGISAYTPGIFLLEQSALNTIKDIKIIPTGSQTVKLLDGKSNELQVRSLMKTTTNLEQKIDNINIDLNPAF